MDRQRPDTTSNELELYIRTYYSLLRSSGEVRVRSFEEAHGFSKSSLHARARQAAPDVAAFAYAAARLPDCMPELRRIVLGQSEEQFVSFGYDVSRWQRVTARGRRRPTRWNGSDTLAVFIASASDIDDLIPMLTAYQIEWNKMSTLLGASDFGRQLAHGTWSGDDTQLRGGLQRTFDLQPNNVDTVMLALDPGGAKTLAAMAGGILDLRVRLLASSFNQYQRAAQRWWNSIAPIFPRTETEPDPRPTYFVSSNTHALVNLLGGYALAHRDTLLQTAASRVNAEVVTHLKQALTSGHDDAANLLYFTLRQHLQHQPEQRAAVQRWDSASGITTAPDPSHIEVGAQVIEISRLLPERFDPRLQMPELSRLQQSNAVVVNIDYPLGMAAYQLLSRLCQGIGSLLGVFVMGKAATLNARVGDVLIANAVFDEHSKNTYVFGNAFAASDVAPYLLHGSVLDNQKVLTARGTYLQNRKYMGVFYKEGYTVMEMEAGPYLSAIFELVDPQRHPRDEIVYLGDRTSFPVGFLHYASDTPYSRRQTLLSHSLNHLGMDSTYACAIAITRRILSLELARLHSPQGATQTSTRIR